MYHTIPVQQAHWSLPGSGEDTIGVIVMGVGSVIINVDDVDDASCIDKYDEDIDINCGSIADDKIDEDFDDDEVNDDSKVDDTTRIDGIDDADADIDAADGDNDDVDCDIDDVDGDTDDIDGVDDEIVCSVDATDITAAT